jgi:hypothetical protein
MDRNNGVLSPTTNNRLQVVLGSAVEKIIKERSGTTSDLKSRLARRNLKIITYENSPKVPWCVEFYRTGQLMTSVWHPSISWTMM